MENNIDPIIKQIIFLREYYLKGKYHCMADLLFILFAFSYFAYIEWTTDLLVWSNPNQTGGQPYSDTSLCG